MNIPIAKPATAILTLSAASLFAGEVIESPVVPPAPSGFENIRRPISNPTLFDLALPQTQVHAIYMHHKFPDMVDIIGGGEVAFGGDLNLYAIQFEYAFNERLSLVAMKDGYIDFNPDETFNSETGFANLAAGLKYAFILKPETQYVMSGSAVLEIPTGNGDVFQGRGDGNINLSLQNAKLWNQWQLATSLGVQIPFDSGFSTISWVGAHLSYEIVPWFIPLVELNWLHVISDGDGMASYKNQGGNTAPAVATFEGADLINWGAANSSGSDYVTAAFGFRSRLTESVDVGFAYEIPLTDEQENITDERFTLDLVWTF